MDLYQHWRTCLAAGKPAGSDDPQCGFWRRTLYRGSPFQPVAVFMREGEIVCVAGDVERPVYRVWTPFMLPISEDVYREARRIGHFHDDLIAPDGSRTTDLATASVVLPPQRTRR